MTVSKQTVQKQAQHPNKKYTQGRAKPNRSDVESVQKDTGSKQKVQQDRAEACAQTRAGCTPLAQM
jgi:hypothetical protein